MLYAIAIIPNFYTNNVVSNKLIRFVRDDDGQNNITWFNSILDAKLWIDNAESSVYMLSNGEAERPNYYILDENDAEYMWTGRNADDSNYDWDKFECEHGTTGNGGACGECDECLEYKEEQDRQYIIDNEVIGN